MQELCRTTGSDFDWEHIRPELNFRWNPVFDTIADVRMLVWNGSNS